MSKSTDTCVIYDKYFIDDLLPYSLVLEKNKLKINYSNQKSAEVDTSKAKSTLIKCIANTKKLNSSLLLGNCWYPVFVDSTTSTTQYNLLNSGSMSNSDTLGIDDAITFEPDFQNWSIGGSAKMTIDWIINSFYSPYLQHNGILCWYKESSSNFIPGTNFYDIPPHCVLIPNQTLSYQVKDTKGRTKNITINSTNKVIKLNNSLLRIVGASSQTFDETNKRFIFKETEEFFNIDAFLSANFPRQNNETDIAYKTRLSRAIRDRLVFSVEGAANSTNPNFLFPSSTKDISLHIPNGECYSYFQSESDKIDAFRERNYSETYISSTLYPIYREIFNTLTINQKRDLKVSLTTGQWRSIHKLACFLSTHPDIDRTTVSILTHDDIQLYINTYLNTKPSSIETETQNLYKAISFITKYFHDLSADIKNGQYTTIVRDEKQLFSRLISKYSAKLSIISSACTLTFKDKLKYGAHIGISQDIFSLGNRNLNNQFLYNNFNFKIGNYQISSNISNNTANISLKNTQARERKVIPLWDLEKKRYPAAAVLSAGKDLIIPLNTKEPGEEIIYRLEDDESIIIGGGLVGDEIPNISWTRISGPDCLRFSDSGLSTIRSEGGFSGKSGTTLVTADGLGNTISNPVGASSGSATPPISTIGLRYESSSDEIPVLYIKNRGKYILRVRSQSSVGIFYDTKIIYVVDKDGFYDDSKTRPRITQGKPITIEPKNKIVSVCPNLRSFAVSKQGYFWPRDSDVNIKIGGQFVFGQVFPFGGDTFKYRIPLSKDSSDNFIYESEPAEMSLTYNPNNTKILINSIRLINMMDNNDDCNKCEGFFKNLLDNKGHILDVNDSFTLIQDPLPGDTASKQVEFDFGTDISTDRAKIYSYGGFDENTVKQLNVSLPYHYSYNKPLPPLTGAQFSGPLNKSGQSKHLCYLESVQKYEEGIIFDKGCFHPSSGLFITGSGQIANAGYDPYKTDVPDLLNTTAVINFDAAHRKTFVFKGAGFFDLTTSNNDVGASPRTYRSDITLSIARDAREARASSTGPTKEELIAAELKEIPDHNINYGYRDSSGSFAKLQIINSDEFDTDVALEAGDGVMSNEYCNEDSSQSYKVSYQFTKRGPYVFPDSARAAQGSEGIPNRFEKSIGSASIEDLEVEINFLNYVNTKNLIIWLDVIPCDAERERINKEGEDRWSHMRSKMENSIFSSTSHRDTVRQIDDMPDGPLKDYTKSLFNMNENVGSTMRLYLLNQEHIEGNRYNFSLRFSDNANKYTTSNNSNNTEYIDPQQIKAIEKDGVVHLLPTIAPSGYSDVEVQFFRKILQTNNLETVNNKFMKFNGLKLFRVGDKFAQDSWGSTTFSLGIAVVNPSVDMVPYDNISNIDIAAGIDSTIVTNKSTLLVNSICSWNLILHVDANGESCNRFRPDGAIGNLTYKYDLNPRIPGYSFVANFKDKKFLLPPINLNAPYSSLLDSNLCKYTLEKLTAPAYSYPDLQILPIITIPGAFSIGGALAAVESVNSQMDALSKGIVAYFTQLRRQAQAEVYSRNLYIPKYDKYAMGEADKVLLSVSKDGALWYKLEASIFKYSNCPILKRKKYTYLKLNYKTARSLSIFNFDKIQSIDALFDLDTDNIKEIHIPIDKIDQLNNITSSGLESKMNEYIKQRNVLVERLNKARSPQEAENLSKEIERLNRLMKQYGATIESIGIRVKKFDIVSVIQDEEVNAKTKGLYLILSDSLDKNPKTPIRLDVEGTINPYNLLNKLRKDNLINFANLQIEKIKDNNNKEILVIKNHLISTSGLRPFYFFDIGDEVSIIRPLADYLAELRDSGKQENLELANRLEAEVAEIRRQLDVAIKNKDKEKIKLLEQLLWDKTNILSTNQIINKGYVFTKDGHKTILELSSPPIGTAISVSPEQSKVAMIYDGDFATIDNKENKPFNKWSFTSNSNSIIKTNRAPETNVSTFGEHSYGTGSLLVDPPTITYKNINNEILPLEEYIGLEYTPRKRNIKIYIDDKPYTTMSIIGYEYSADDISYIQNTLENIQEVNSFGVSMNLKRFFKHNHTFTKLRDRVGLMDVRSDVFSQYSSLPDYGYIELDLGLEADFPKYSFTREQASIIQSRINFLINTARLQNSISGCPDENKTECISRIINGFDIYLGSINDLQVYIENSSYIRGTKSEIFIKIENAKNHLSKLMNELSNIYRYCEIGKITIREEIQGNAKKIVCIPYEGPSPIPLNTIEVKTTNNNQLEFIESLENDDYWINIDPEQGCSIDFTETPKILVETKIECLPLSDVATSEAPAVCPKFAVNIIAAGADKHISADSSRTVTYKISPKKFNQQITEYRSKNPKLRWEGTPDSFGAQYSYMVTRYFSLNLAGKERNALIRSTEKYFLPTNVIDKTGHTQPDGTADNKVKNIFNLDNIDQLKVKFKRIPRKIKNIDMLFELYRPNALGQLTKSITPAPGGPIDPTLRLWRCYDTQTGLEAEPTIHFKWLNEMIFRGYYGSVDAAEFKGSRKAESKEITDWIPYDYL